MNSRKPNGQGVTLNKPAKSTKKSAPKPIQPTNTQKQIESLTSAKVDLEQSLLRIKAQLKFYQDDNTKLTKKCEKVEVLKRHNASLQKEVRNLEDEGKIKGLLKKIAEIKTENC